MHDGNDEISPFQMLWQAISVEIDGGGSSEMAVVTFDGIAILTPRWENPTTLQNIIYKKYDIVECLFVLLNSQLLLFYSGADTVLSFISHS